MSGALALLPKSPQTDLLVQIAKDEGIPIMGITILGGKPYVNTTGLDVKLKSKCDVEKLVHVSTEYIPIQAASKENGLRAGGWGVVKLFDKTGFEKALALASKGGPVTKDVIDSLKELYFRIYKMRGFASPETIQMSSMAKHDNIEAMAERRATNRAKREATGTGLTSTDEMDENGPEGMAAAIETTAHEIEAQREAVAAPVGDTFQTEGVQQGAAFISKDQTQVLNKLMLEFALTPTQFKDILAVELKRTPKGTADIRKPEYQAIVKLFDSVRAGAVNLRNGKIERPVDAEPAGTHPGDDSIPF